MRPWSTDTASEHFFIGIDDTDYGESIGTGGVARELQLHLVRELGAEPLGATRHQLFVHPDIPYTSHNSAACIEVRCRASLDTVASLCKTFLTFFFHPGADPGLCIAPSGAVPPSVLDFGRRAQSSVVTEEESVALAEAAGFGLWPLGGTGLGIIGALCACGLRMDGNDGRFLALGGIRAVPHAITVGALLGLTPIARVVEASGRELAHDVPLNTQTGVRPALIGGRPVLVVEKAGATYRTIGTKKDDQ